VTRPCTETGARRVVLLATRADLARHLRFDEVDLAELAAQALRLGVA
jgi:hypothetical protein